jgi:hypothetical protein
MRARMMRALAVLVAAMAPVLSSGAVPAGAAAASPHYNYVLTGVSAVSRSDAWAVGSYTAAGHSYILGLHWNGRSWARTPLPSIRGSLNGVSGVSRSDVWAVGQTSRSSLILHWSGSRWRQVPSPSPGQLSTTLSAVAGTSATNAWAVGEADNDSGGQVLILHWDGTNWTQAAPVSLGGVSFLSGVASASGSDAWTVGEYYPTSASPNLLTLTLHWVGSSWRVVPSPNPRKTTGSLLNAVSQVSAKDAWAVGYDYPDKNIVPGVASVASLVLRWDGRSWRIVPSPDPRGSVETRLEGVSAVSGSDAWAVGYYASRQPDCCAITRAVILHWNGRTWSLVPIPNPGRPGHQNNALYGVGASARNAWAVGSYYRYPADRPLILRWNGRAWLNS